MKDSMLKPVRVDAGLGDPPVEYKNNDPESANFIIKHGLHFNASKPHEFVEKIKNIVETQQRNEERAVFGRGSHRVRKEFEHLTVDDTKISHLNHEQLRKKVLEFKKASMNDMRDILSPVELETQESGSPVQQLGLNITARESGINTIPMTILESIFERASNLIAKPGSVIPKPGADDGSFIVAGTCNKIHCVTPGKGGSLSCDRSCVNVSTKICEHVLAVAQKKEMLDEFISWFRKRRKRGSMMDMVEQGGPKTAGRKPSGRKRTNAKAKPVERYVDLLTNEESDSRAVTSQQPASSIQHHSVHPPQPMSAFPTDSQIPSTQQRSTHPSQAMSAFPSGPQMPSTQQHSVHPSQPMSAFPSGPQMPSTHQQSFYPSQAMPAFPTIPQIPSVQQPSIHSPFAMSAMWTLPSASQTPSSCSDPSTHTAAMRCSASEAHVSQYLSMASFNPSSNFRGHYVPHHSLTTNAYQSSRFPHPLLPNSQESQNSAFQTTPTSSTTNQVAGVPLSFYLKWVEGTKVSKCYGCGGIIKNPPENRPDDLIILTGLTGQLQRSSSAQNVHFHLRRECLVMRYPAFHVGLLSITPAFRAALYPEHHARLLENFGWSQN